MNRFEFGDVRLPGERMNDEPLWMDRHTGLVGAGDLDDRFALLRDRQGADGASESWDAVYIRGSRVGYFHTQVFPVADRGRNLLRVQVDMSLSFKRNGDPISIETLYGTIETPDGTVLRLDSRTVASRHFRARSGGPVSTARRLTPCVLHAPAGG